MLCCQLYVGMTCNDQEIACIHGLVRINLQQQKDLLHLTNAGDDLGYAVFITDLAAAAGALNVLVIRDPNFAKDPTRSEFRGFPLVNTEKLLEFIDTEVSPGEDQNVQYDMPFKVPLFAWGGGYYCLLTNESNRLKPSRNHSWLSIRNPRSARGRPRRARILCCARLQRRHRRRLKSRSGTPRR